MRTSLKFGSVNVPGKTGRAVHFIPNCRLPGVKAFSRWKEGAKTSLGEFGLPISRVYGENIAKVILSSLMDRHSVPSVNVLLDDGETIHLPPKVAFLMKHAVEVAQEKGEGESAVKTMMGDFKDKPSDMNILKAISEIGMGDARLYSVCADYNESSRWRDVVKVCDKEEIVHVLVLDDAQFILADSDQFGMASDTVFRDVCQSEDFRKTAQDVFVSALSRLGIKVGIPVSRMDYIMEGLEIYGEAYMSEKFQDTFIFPELAIPLGIECNGRLKQC